ncbi:MAG: HNH endonuclease family protein [Brevinema sp.]
MNKKNHGETVRLKYRDYSLEHLMPQKWTQHWPLTNGISEEDRNTYLNMIGNFTLLKGNLNTQIGNK